MKIINYTRNDHRSSIKVTTAQHTAMQYIKKREKIKSDQEFIEKVYTMCPYSMNVSMAVRDAIILNLLQYAMRRKKNV